MAEDASSPPPTRRLAFRLTLAISAVVFAASSAFLWLALRAHETATIEEVGHGVALLSETLAASLHDDMLAARKDAAYRRLDGAARAPGLVRVRLFSKDGHITFSSERSGVGTLVDMRAESCHACHAAGQPLLRLALPSRVRVYGANGGRTLAMVTPLYNQPSCANAECHAHPASQQVLGVLDVAVSLAVADAGAMRLRRHVAGIGLLAVVSVAALAYLSIRTLVARPLAEAVAATAEVAAGNLEQPLPVRRDDEIGRLARAFNAMREALAESRAAHQALLADLERKVAERGAALQAAERQGLRAERLAALGRLSASIAHEINNPLAGILTFAKLILRDREDDPAAPPVDETVSRLRLIARETERCSAIVRELLDFARERPLTVRLADVNAAIEESLSLVGHQVELQGIRLAKELGALPQVAADFGQLRQAFVNVILNACDAMPGGGTLTIRSRAGGAHVEVSVQDSGPGIKPEFLGRLFDPFFTTKEKGTGLGLSVVYGIVERHGGTVEAHNAEGGGAVLLFRLPIPAA